MANRNVSFIKVFFIASLCALAACKRAAEEATQFTIQIPTAKQMSEKFSAQSAVDFDSMCFVVDVQGSNITSIPANTCQPEKGTMFGGVSAGQVVSGSVTEGTYTFKVYGLKKDSGGCPGTINPELWNGWGLKKIYLLGEKVGQAVSGPTADINIVVSLPDENDHLFAHNSLPASCDPSSESPMKNGRDLMSADKLILGTTYRAYSRVNNRPDTKILSGTMYKIKNWKAGAL